MSHLYPMLNSSRLLPPLWSFTFPSGCTTHVLNFLKKKKKNQSLALSEQNYSKNCITGIWIHTLNSRSHLKGQSFLVCHIQIYEILSICQVPIFYHASTSTCSNLSFIYILIPKLSISKFVFQTMWGVRVCNCFWYLKIQS